MLNNYEKLVALLSNQSDKDRFKAPAGKTHASYKGWLTDHEGVSVDTLQATVQHDTGELVFPWAPANRTIKTRSSFATFDGSRRDYKGVKVLASDDKTIVVTDGDQVWAHVVTDNN